MMRGCRRQEARCALTCLKARRGLTCSSPTRARDRFSPCRAVFLDIGANLGWYSMLFAQAGFDVIAVEAMQRNADAIRSTLCLNPRLSSKVNARGRDPHAACRGACCPPSVPSDL